MTDGSTFGLYLLGCYAYWCFCCFLGTLADRIGESKVSCCCVPNVLGIYRMKVRSVLRIEVSSIDRVIRIKKELKLSIRVIHVVII